ncbi:hypothetical protein [Kitasatospora aureofaciens]|uniref:hypothetical protein n=1 Tax=Kitasatospora aureofaciens TaxID=1894 RepID=UPI0036F483F2
MLDRAGQFVRRGVQDARGPERRNALIGRVAPSVSVPEVRRTVRRFFARHLA